MIKYLGIMLISSGVFIFGNAKSSELSHAKKLSSELLDLFRTLERELTFENNSKLEIFSHFSGKLLNECGFIDALKHDTNYKVAINSHLYALDKKEKELLIEFFSEFGKSISRKKEADRCKSFIAEFEQAVKQSSILRQNKAILYRKLGIICALMTAVILI